MEDYGMCCGPNEARQCEKEYYERLEMERQQERKEDIKKIIVYAIVAIILVAIPVIAEFRFG